MNHAPVETWGRLVRPEHPLHRPASEQEAWACLKAATEANVSVCPAGLGRSYGDSAQPARHGWAISSRRLDHFLHFDRETGVLRAEAGVSLDQLLRVSVPAGWFLPVSPGSKYVTLAGAVANDVHGKNHHQAGTFGRHVRSLGLLGSDGARHVLEPRHPRFQATVGGLGLTGLIMWVEVQLIPLPAAALAVERQPFHGLAEFMALSTAAEAAFPYVVAWLDCVNQFDDQPRGVLSQARFVEQGELTPHRETQRWSVPLNLPGFCLNRLTVGAFNRAYFRLQRDRSSRQHYDGFFYPLDGIGQWNRIYGRRGFFQHQSVVPLADAEAVLGEMLSSVARSGQASFLSVLKRFGNLPSPGMLSFPRAGVTLAMDFPNRGEKTRQLLVTLDQQVLAAGGRIYPAKDARLGGKDFTTMYPAVEQFSKWIDPHFSSSFWQRVSDA